MKNFTMKDLLKDGFSEIPYPQQTKDAVLVALAAWKEFCNQPITHKELISFEKNGGYEMKNQTQNPSLLDHKEDFHITRRYEFPKDFEPSFLDTIFKSVSIELFESMRPILIEIAKILTEGTGIDFLKLAVKNEDGWTLRFLHYFPQENQSLAIYHPDKGGHTFHLHDSTPGFERFWNNKWQSMSFDHHKMVFFMGLLGQLYSKCLLKGLAHRVINSQESRKNGRYSIVLFNDYTNASLTYNKKEFGPTQKLFQPGENYELSYKQFLKYFTKRVIQDNT